MLFNEKNLTIKERVKKFSIKANAIYWTSILNVLSFLILIFDKRRTYAFGYSINLYLHGLLMNSSLNEIAKYSLSFIFCLIPAAIFFVLAIFVKKGKLIPLIVAFILYIFDTIFLFFIPKNYILISEESVSYSQVTPYLLHFIMICYFIYLLVTYKNIVMDSKLNKKSVEK